jgi:hypothetical protein
MKALVAFVIAVLALGTGAGPAQAQARASVAFDRDGLRTFHVSVGEHYGYPYREVVRVHSGHIHPDELPVVFFLARESRVRPETVVALRTRGWSWWDVSVRLGLRADVFVAHLPRRIGPPHGRAHGYWARRDGRRIRHLSDREIVDYVNLHFLTAYHRRTPREVIVLREQGRSYVQVQAALGGATAGPPGARPPLRTGAGPGVTMKEDPRRGPQRPGRGRGGGRP